MATATEKTFSSPFAISRYGTKQDEANADHQQKNLNSIRFVLRNGKPIKLGDGSFGTVYLGINDNTERDVAIKLLYDSSTLKPRRLSDIRREELLPLIQSLAKTYGLDETQLGKLIVDHADSDYNILRKLQLEYKHPVARSPSLSAAQPEPTEDDGQETSSKTPRVLLTNQEPDFVAFLDDLTKIARSSAVYRFQSERAVTGILMDSNAKKTGVKETPPGLVEVLGGTDDFTAILNRDGFEGLRETFDGIHSSKISNYVLVMDRYLYSLKDLLERKIIDRDPTRNGYDVLKSLPLDLRVREALVLLVNVAFGLYQLHNADNPFTNEPLFHRDIKPGNIFIKERLDSGFQVDLGDLGNLPLLPTSAPTDLFSSIDAESINNDYAPGTQHYRSPEQKYYTDVANVRIQHMTQEELNQGFENFIERNVAGINAPKRAASSAITSLEEANQDNTANLPGGENLPDGQATIITANAQADVVENQLAQTIRDIQTRDRQDLHSSRNGSKKLVVLIVTDPKFKNTLIEPEDVVILSKDTERKPRMIVRRYAGSEQSGFHAFVLNDDIGTNPILEEDDKTQVEFYKKQRFRTDLFGIGAVVFDMITAGWSPEKFYESLRKFETLSVADIMRRYDTLRRGEMEGENPDLSQIFAPFRNDNDPTKRYPNNDIIEFILKCMLYQSEGTFYHLSQDPREASKSLYNEIVMLRDQYTKVHPDISSSESILIHRPALTIGTTAESIQLDMEIARLQSIERWPAMAEIHDPALRAANRLLYGAHYFTKVIDLIRTKINETADDVQKSQSEPNPHTLGHYSPYLRQILPAYISLKWKDGEAVLDFDSAPSWQYRETLLKELRDNRLEQLIRSSANSFVPNRIAGMRREIRLFAAQETQNGQAESHEFVRCTFRFRDASPFDLTVAQDDWIVCQEQLWEVIEVIGTDHLHIRQVPFGEQTELWEQAAPGQKEAKGLVWSEDGSVEGIYFSAIDPFKYYLDMLGIYLQHLLFVYSPLTTTTRKRVDINVLLNAFEINAAIHDIYIEPLQAESAERDYTGGDLGEIHTNFVRLLLMLTMHDSKDSYYEQMVSESIATGRSQNTTGREMINAVKEFAEHQYKRILNLLGRRRFSLSDYPELITSFEHIPEFKGMIDELLASRFDIEKTIKRFGLIAWENKLEQ